VLINPKLIKRDLLTATLSFALCIALIAQAWAQSTPPKMKMTTDIPASITTPDSVETSIGTLKFADGFPDDSTVQKVYDNLDFVHGVDAFLNAMPGASTEAIRTGFASQGADNNQTVLIMEDLMDSKSLFLTPNTESIYNLMWLDTKAGPLVNGSTKPAVESSRKFAKVYRLADGGNPPPMKFINVSGKAFNTIHANDFHFYDEVNNLVQYEPNEAYSPEILGTLAAIGIEKGKPFAPDARMKKILNDAAAVGNATARAIVFKSRQKDTYLYPNSAWFTCFIGGSYEFLSQLGVRDLDARVHFIYYATGVTPAMARSPFTEGHV
jgi:hypothetical protein